LAIEHRYFVLMVLDKIISWPLKIMFDIVTVYKGINKGTCWINSAMIGLGVFIWFI